MDDFLENLAAALNNPSLEINPEDKLQDLPNWDSLAILTTLSMLDEEYDVTLTGTDLQACNSVADLYEKVQESRPAAS